MSSRGYGYDQPWSRLWPTMVAVIPAAVTVMTNRGCGYNQPRLRLWPNRGCSYDQPRLQLWPTMVTVITIRMRLWPSTVDVMTNRGCGYDHSRLRLWPNTVAVITNRGCCYAKPWFLLWIKPTAVAVVNKTIRLWLRSIAFETDKKIILTTETARKPTETDRNWYGWTFWNKMTLFIIFILLSRQKNSYKLYSIESFYFFWYKHTWFPFHHSIFRLNQSKMLDIFWFFLKKRNFEKYSLFFLVSSKL